MTGFLTILTSASQRYATKRFTDAGKMGVELSRTYTCRRAPFADIFELHSILGVLAKDPFSFVIRGEPVSDLDVSRPTRRLKYRDGSDGPAFQSSPDGVHWLCFDFDDIECPANIDPIRDPDRALDHLRHLLPACFHDVTCSWQWSSSAGLDGWTLLHAHLWFVLAASADDDTIRAWARRLELPVDLALFNTVQPHFTARPIFDGRRDPLQQRNEILLGERHAATVDFATSSQTMRGMPLRRSLAKPVGTRSQCIEPARPILVDGKPRDPIRLRPRVGAAYY